MSNSKNDATTVIQVKNVHKDFYLPHEQRGSLKGMIVNAFKKRDKEVDIQHVLRGLSFDVKEGEFFGIVGRNGSGKSTLLKIISEIYKPTRGSVKSYGKLVPFIELGVGFNPELTGRENVYLNGALLGFSRDEISEKYDDIVEFAELGEFMDQKLKNYSSGMQVRLAFSVAIQADGDVLILDEVLAVGDEAFQRKCDDYFSSMKKVGKTIVLVTHDMESVRKYCSRAMLIQDGEIKQIGEPNVIADEYYGVNLAKDQGVEQDEDKPMLAAKIIGKRVLKPSDVLRMKITYQSRKSRPLLAKAYVDFNGQAVMATNPRLLGWCGLETNDAKEHSVIYELPLDSFNKGEYKIITILEDPTTGLNITSMGYDGETMIKVANPDPSSSGGAFINRATMHLEV